MPKEDIFGIYCMCHKVIRRIDLVILNFLGKDLNFIKEKAVYILY